jgi:ABC-type nitrate/sulfonate/bicarbonate transport system substrate-binding protein
MEDKMKLEKGYTPEQLNAFWQALNAAGKKARRTPDGGWEVYEPLAESAHPPIRSKKSSPVESNRTNRLASNPVEKVEKVEKIESEKAAEQPKKTGFWKRLFGIEKKEAK